METSWAVFLCGLGLGSVATSIIQHLLARSAKKADTLVNEKKEAFTGYLAALAKVNENNQLRENLANYGLWVARVQLVTAPDITQAIEAMLHTTPGTPERKETFDRILNEMRKDLGYQ